MAENLTPQQAARVLADASRYEDGLHQRTEGLTLMLWGLVTSGIFVTSGFVAVLDGPWYAFATVWIPWVAFGVAFTFALWRSAALSRAQPASATRRGDWIKTAGLTLAVSIAFWIVRPTGPEIPLVVIGATYAVMHGVNLFGSSARGRWLGFAGASFLAVLGLALALLDVPIEASGFVAMLAPGLTLGALGLWQTLRG